MLSDSPTRLLILFWDTCRKILAAAQLVRDINPRSSLKTWRHIRNKNLNSLQVDPRWCLAPFGETVGNVGCFDDIVGRRRTGRMTGWWMVKKSLNERAVYWNRGTVTHLDGGGVAEGDADWHVWEAQVWFITNRGLPVVSTSKKTTTLQQDQMSASWKEWQNVMSWNQTTALKGNLQLSVRLLCLLNTVLRP